MTESPLIYLLNHLSNSGSWAGNYPRCHRVRGRVYLGQVYNRANKKATNLELVTLTCVTVGGWHWEKLRRYRENMLHTKMAQLTRKDKLCFEARLLTTVSTCHSSSKMSIIKQSKYIKPFHSGPPVWWIQTLDLVVRKLWWQLHHGSLSFLWNS